MLHEDDLFHPNNIDEDEFDFQFREPSLFSESASFSTVDARRKNLRKLGDDYKKLDKGYNKIKAKNGYQPVDIEFYTTTSHPGVAIRDAITGAKIPEHRVGSRNEDLYFKANFNIGQEMCHMFYDSPEQFERHMHTNVDETTKQKWMEKCVAARLRTM